MVNPGSHGGVHQVAGGHDVRSGRPLPISAKCTTRERRWGQILRHCLTRILVHAVPLVALGICRVEPTPLK